MALLDYSHRKAITFDAGRTVDCITREYQRFRAGNGRVINSNPILTVVSRFFKNVFGIFGF